MPTNDTKTDDSKGPVVVWFESHKCMFLHFYRNFIQWGWLTREISDEFAYSENLGAFCWLKKNQTLGVVGQPDNLWSCSRLNKGASSPAAKQINHLMAYMMTNQSDILACSKAGESSWKVVGRAVVFWTSISGSRVEGVDFPKMWYAWEVLWKISISCITHTNLSYLLNHIELSYPLIYIR